MVTGVAVVLSLMTWFSATAVLPEIKEQFSLTNTQSAWLTNAVQLGFAFGALVSSFIALSDIFPLTRLMAYSAVSAGIANLLLLLDTGATTLILARVVTGIALAGIYPPAMKFIASWFKTGRGLAMGAMVGALTLGSAMPHLVRAIGFSVDWTVVVVVCSIGSFFAALIFGFLLKEGPHGFPKTKFDIRHMGKIFQNRPAMLANIGYFGHMWELYAMWAWIMLYISYAFSSELNLFNASAAAFVAIAMGAPGCLFGGWLADRIGRCNTSMLMLGISGFSALLVGFVFGGPTWLFLVVVMIWGFSVVADSAQFSAAVTELSDSRYVGAALAFQMGVGFSITIFVIWIIPIVANLLGSWRWAFLVLVPGPFVGMFAMYVLRKAPESVAMADGNR